MKTTIGKLKKLIREAAIVGKYPETAEEHAQNINDEIEFKSSWGGLVTDPAHWAGVGVHTGEELARYLAIETYSDAYKHATGMRPRGVNFDEMSVEEIDAEVNRLYDEPSPYEDDVIEPEPDPKEFETPSLTHNPFAGLKR